MRDETKWMKRIEHVLPGSVRVGDLYKLKRRGHWHEVECLGPTEGKDFYWIMDTDEHVVNVPGNVFVYVRRLKGKLSLKMFDDALRKNYGNQLQGQLLSQRPLLGGDPKVGKVRIEGGGQSTKYNRLTGRTQDQQPQSWQESRGMMRLSSKQVDGFWA